MCGIAGYSCYGEYDRRLDVAITTLGLFMQDRGRQAWGWTDGKQLVKATGSIREGWNGSFLGRFPQAALHTRQPTHGAVIRDNSHPFQIGRIVGVHNGIVYNHEELNKKYERNFAVDSMHIFAHLDQGMSLNELRAYGAVVFWKDGKLHLGRFNNGDLSLARTETAWVFASTKFALADALRLSGLNKNVFYYKLKEERCYILDGEELKISDEIKLDFGSYSKNAARWEDYEDFPTDGARRWGYNSNEYKEEHGWVKEKTSGYGDHWYVYDASKDQRRKDKKESPKSKEKDSKKGTPTQQNLLPPVGHTMSTEQKVAEMVKAFAQKTLEKEKPAERKQEPDWKCGFCQNVLKGNGEAFYMTHTSELCCEDCATRYTEDLIGGPLGELPQDICKIESLMTEADKKSGETLQCDVCDEPFEVTDEFVHTKDGSFLCIQCFANGGGEETTEEEIDMAAAEDAYYKEMFDRAMAQASRQGEFEALEGEVVANEAENLKNHGAAMPEASSQVTELSADEVGFMGCAPFGSRFLN